MPNETSLLCPHCGATTRVEPKNGKVISDGRAVRRTRVCSGRIRHNFATYERAETGLVRKQSGSTEDFDRSKLERGLLVAVNKRPVDHSAVRALVEAVADEVKQEGPLDSQYIGDRCLAFLRSQDDVAYIRYLSVYREFGSLTQFRDEIARLDASLTVQKSKGDIEPFDRTKLLRGLQRAVNRRSIPYQQLDEIVNAIAASASDSGMLTSSDIGEQALAALRELDVVAYVRFASVYRDFGSIDDFLAELHALKADDA